MAKLLDFVLHCNSAMDDADDLLRMADPEGFGSRAEMGEYFEEYLNYNPMTYFDEKMIIEELNEFTKLAPHSVQGQLYSKREEIIERTLECIQTVNADVIDKVLQNVIESIVGWKITSDEEEPSVDDCILMAVYEDEEIGFPLDDDFEGLNIEDDDDLDEDDELEEFFEVEDE